MKILNICMSAPFTENYSYQDNLLSEYQYKHGNQVTVVCTTKTRDVNGIIIETSPGEKILSNGVKLIRLSSPNRIKQMLGFYSGLTEIIENEKPDLLFIHGLASFIPAIAVRYKKKHRVTIVADNHQDEGTTYTRKFPFNILLWIYKICWKKWIYCVDKVYGTTSWRKTFAHKYYGIPNDKLDTLIMGIDTDRLPKNWNDTRKSERTRLGINSNAFLFISGGKLDKNKATIEMMKAFIAVKEENIRLLLFGSVLKDIEEEFNELLDHDNRIIYIGYVNSKDIQKLFIAADFGLFPGRHSVLWEEAIGCGLPCVFRKYEDVDHTDVNGNCIRIESADEQKLSDLISKIIEDKIYYSEIKERAMIASEAYSYHTIADKSVECAKNVGRGIL